MSRTGVGHLLPTLPMDLQVQQERQRARGPAVLRSRHMHRARGSKKKKKAPFCAQHRARPPSAAPGCPAAHREAPKGSAWAPCPRSSRTSRRRTPRRASGPLKKSWASVCGADAEQPHARGRVSDAKGSPVPLAVPSLSRTPPRRHWPRRRLVSHSHSRKDLAPAQKPHLRKRGRRCRQEAAASLSSGAMGTAQHSPVRGDHRRSGGCRHVAPAATGASTSNQRFLFSFLPRTRAVVLVGGNAIMARKRRCNDCGGAAMCEHKLEKRRSSDSGRAAMCEQASGSRLSRPELPQSPTNKRA